MKSDTILVFTISLFVIVVISGCIQATEQPTKNAREEGVNVTTSDETTPIVDWKQVELSDVKTGAKFKISDFKSKPVLLESFAVWCPVCNAQQKEIKKLKDLEGDKIVHLSVDTDPNEDEKIVKDYLAKNNFDWYFAVAPSEFTKSLINQFGVRVVYAPSAAIVIVCENQSARLLPSGVKTPEKLKAELEKGC